MKFGKSGYSRMPPKFMLDCVPMASMHVSHIFVRSSGVTPGMAGSSKIRPSRNSMM
jgi:hypothetical protein